MADSLIRVSDSLRKKATEARSRGLSILQPAKKESKPASKNEDPVEEGTELVLKNLYTGEEKNIHWSPTIASAKKEMCCWWKPPARPMTPSRRPSCYGLHCRPVQRIRLCANLMMRAILLSIRKEHSSHLQQNATVLPRRCVKFHKLWYFKAGDDSARIRADRNTAGIAKGLTVSDSYTPLFSKDGQKLFSDYSPSANPRTLPWWTSETARLDIWNYKR